MIYVAAFFASFVFVALKASQQRHVVYNDWALIMPTSLGMAFCEYYVLATIVKTGFTLWLVLAGGTGAGLGCITAMLIHNRHLKRKQK